MAVPDITLTTNPKETLRLMDQINVLTMSPADRRRILKQIGKQTRQDFRKNVQGQQTIEGSPMEPRADKKKKRMFSKMAKAMITKVINDHKAIVTWKNPGKAKLAYKHHHGQPEKFTAKKAARMYGVPNYNKPATILQAKALNKEGFKRPVARKRGKGKAIMKRVPQRWIRENMTLGQAGLILRMMRYNSEKGKQSWTIKTPARPILGATIKDADKYLTAMATNALQKIKKV
ncbi:MAG: hypothetical protein GY710_27385 [Desulfobacteraceae bacterium]|nr:hypothetical protein [Desulfobacteraceae bacterium]